MTELRSERLFSYGTLQLEAVQRELFGRLLAGERDELPGFVQEAITIDDPETVRLSGKTQHSIARRTGHDSDGIPGTVYAITPAELQRADEYEADGYQRIAVVMRSGTRAWVYVAT